MVSKFWMAQARRRKVGAAGTTLYVGKLYECTNGACARNIYAGSQLLASVATATGTVKYYHLDHLGSPRLTTDTSGTPVEAFFYKPFGEAAPATSGRRFTGQILDAETGLYFYNARYYDPQLGRFISPDTIIQDQSNPQTLNRYTYSGNNPVRFSDPSGHQSSDATEPHPSEAIEFQGVAPMVTSHLA